MEEYIICEYKYTKIYKKKSDGRIVKKVKSEMLYRNKYSEKDLLQRYPYLLKFAGWKNLFSNYYGRFHLDEQKTAWLNKKNEDYLFKQNLRKID